MNPKYAYSRQRRGLTGEKRTRKGKKNLKIKVVLVRHLALKPARVLFESWSHLEGKKTAAKKARLSWSSIMIIRGENA